MVRSIVQLVCEADDMAVKILNNRIYLSVAVLYKKNNCDVCSVVFVKNMSLSVQLSECLPVCTLLRCRQQGGKW